MSVAVSERKNATYIFVDPPGEIVLGEPLEIDIECIEGKVSPLDWIGIYPSNVPSLPGLSHNRWKYLSPLLHHNHKESETPTATESNPVKIRVVFESAALPNHSGWFDVRIHHHNTYGTPHCSVPVCIVDSPTSLIRKVFLLAMIVSCVSGFQKLLNAKGTCPFLDPATHVDPIPDYFTMATTGLNRWFIDNPHYAELAQAISSLNLDITVVYLVWKGATRRSSIKPFLSIFIFMALRFIGQIVAVIPCAPGYFFPPGKIMGYTIPTLFVDYHPANDMFFSGHTGTTFVVALEFFRLDCHRIAWFQFGVMLPLIMTWVVSARVHRGMDVFAGLLAAIAACAISKELAKSIDRWLQIGRAVPEIIIRKDSPKGQTADAKLPTSPKKNRQRSLSEEVKKKR